MKRMNKSQFALKMAKAGAVGLLAASVVATSAFAQSLGGFPIREPGAGSSGSSGSTGGGSNKKGPMQIIVDVNGPGPYKTISGAINDVAEGGVVYVMHGVYNESISLEKSVFIQGDRGPGSGVEISAPMNMPCLNFAPKDGTAHAVVANVHFAAKINSGADACINVHQGVFTLKESDVLGSGVRPAVKINGGTVMLEKNRSALRRTKFIMNKGVDQHISASLAMEVAIMPYPSNVSGVAMEGQASIRDFQTKEDRERRRAKSKTFWYEDAQ